MTQDSIPPTWRKPPGVADGTWQYVHQRTIARNYDDFVADTPLCQLDRDYVLRRLDPSSAKELSDNSVKAKGLVLDLGAGTGRLAVPIGELGFDVLAIDLSQSMLEVLRKNCCRKRNAAQNTDGNHEIAGERHAGHPSGSVMTMRANLVQLDALRDSIADHAVCMFSTIGMIQGREHRVRFLRHVARAVRPGGSLIVHVHRRWAALREPGGMGRLFRSARDAVCRSDAEFGDATYAYRGLDKMFMHRFTKREITLELSDAGWTIEHTDYVGLSGDKLASSAWDASGLFVLAKR